LCADLDGSVRGIGLRLYRLAMIAAVLVGVAAPGRALAQYYPPPIYAPPPPADDEGEFYGGPPARSAPGASAAMGADPRGFASLPPEVRPESGPQKELPPQLRRTLVDYVGKEPAGTIIVDTPHTYLYLVLGHGKALRYGIGVGREGFTWSGAEKISRMAQWPDWNPPEQMIARQPYLPRFMAGGEGNPLGARALYLGDTLYRIHGTNQPSTIGSFVSSGCIRLTNEDITDLYSRVKVGTRVVVLSANGTAPAAAAPRRASKKPKPPEHDARDPDAPAHDAAAPAPRREADALAAPPARKRPAAPSADFEE
jgi:lipoprotein-anchoring transpeptidase ErfK/SrfK